MKQESNGSTDYNNSSYDDRRDFLKKLSLIAGSTSGALSLIDSFNNSNASAQTVQENDSRLITERITYPCSTGEMQASLSKPKDDKKLPCVIVIHENRGLNPHIEDVARRFALEGYIAIAPDALSPVGGTPEDSSDARSLFGKLNNQSTVKNFVAAVQYLKTHPQSTGKVGCTGFCWGGGMTNQVAVNSPDLAAAAPFYGRQPDSEDVGRIKASMLIHYGANDDRINAGIEDFEEALKKAAVDYRIYMYEGASHAFFNDTGTRYHEHSAQLAWKRTLAFFDGKLKV